jgi:hypothetical protein
MRTDHHEHFNEADRAVRRQLSGPTVAPEFTRDALTVTAERKAKLRVQLDRVAQHLSQDRIVPRIEAIAALVARDIDQSRTLQ